MNIFVANFDSDVTEDDVEDLFDGYGTVGTVTVWRDLDTGESKGYGFVHMPDDSEAESAIRDLDGKWWHGRRLRVSEARPKR